MHLTGKAGKCIDATIGGKPIDDNRIYTIATIDYVANGGDHMTPLLNAVERINSTVFMRDAVIDYVKRETRANRAIGSMPEERIILTD